MKNTARFTTIILLLMAMSAFAAKPPKDFKGVIKYKITYSGDEISDQMRSFLPKTMKTTMRGHMSKTEMSMGMGKTIRIKNGEEKSVITLFDMMGQKIGMKSDWEEIMEDMAGEPEAEVKFINEQKEIAGYMCDKALITTKDEAGEKQRLIAYYTKELGENINHFDTKNFNQINGILLEFQLATPEFTMTFSATSVDKGGVSKKDFDIPEEFEMKTKEEVESLFGGM